jgi:hypothetical protein
VSSSGDRSACIWDRRKLGLGAKALHTATANNVILSAYFSADGAAPQLLPQSSRPLFLPASHQQSKPSMRFRFICPVMHPGSLTLAWMKLLPISSQCQFARVQI